MALKKLEFTPESGNVDTYGYAFFTIHFISIHGILTVEQPRKQS